MIHCRRTEYTGGRPTADSSFSRQTEGFFSLPLDGDRKPFPVVRGNFQTRLAQFSPDGKWTAYESNESGQLEIYVQPFPGPGPKSRISTNGGAQVRWRNDGKEIFYVNLASELMAVPIRLDSTAQSVSAGMPTALFRARIAGGVIQGTERQEYMVSKGGQRFLISSLVEDTDFSITFILNWKGR
jgi:hypothetical protein